MRKALGNQKRENKDRIRWRGHEVLRIEAFSDAVFAFAVTLLTVSLEVPKNFDELINSMHSFIPFAVCFTILFQVWIVQNTFFRRFGLHDDYTLILNAMLLFVVLFFVYPLKFLFNQLFNNTFNINKPEQGVQLIYIYSGGFAMIYLLLSLMYHNALRKKDLLELTDSEVFETRTNFYRNLSVAGIGILSVVIASFGFRYVGLAGIIYVLIGPAIGLVHSRRGKVHRKKFGYAVQASKLDVAEDDETGHH